MSRIAGFLGSENFDQTPASALKRMLSRLPGESLDSTNVAAAGGVAVSGQEGGPIGWDLGEFGEFTVAIDGRILNPHELSGHAGSGVAGDAAIVAALVRKFGFPETLAMLVGDFALAVINGTTGELWLGRDRFGVKPMYWAGTDTGVWFASLPRAVIAGADLSLEPNRAFVARFAASHYRTFDNAPAESPYRDVAQLPPGHYLHATRRSLDTPKSWWSLIERETFANRSESELAEEYRERLLTAVKRRFDAVEKPVFTLSGGMDSSSIVSCAATISGRKQDAVSSVYTDATYDERHEIEDVVAEHIENWQRVELGDEIEIFSIVDEMVRIHQEPVATATWLSHQIICRDVKTKGYGALFGGLGGDELNFGEYEYFPLFFADLKQDGNDAQLEKEIAFWSEYHDHPIHKKNRDAAFRMMEKLTDPTRPGLCRPDRERMTRYYHTLSAEYFDLSEFSPVMETPFSSYVRNRAFQDMTRETLPCCLRAEDRQCTAAGLEHHDPFLDHELVEFMFRVPNTAKIRNGVTKHILREAMTGILPDATRTRIKKTGWNAPAHKWFGGKSLEALRDLVSSRAFRERGVYDPQAVAAIIDDHVEILESGVERENHMMFLWQLLNCELWLQSLSD